MKCACRLVVLCSFLLVFSLPAIGSDEPEDGLWELSLEDLLDLKVEVASGSEQGAQDLFSTPSAVTVIDAAMIQRYGFTSVEEAVRTVAGISVPRTYLKRDVITSRGILQDHYANKVLVLINGIPAWHAVTGEASLARVNIGSVERIEVLKGPASVVYGTNAYAGAINIVLRRSSDPALNVNLLAGTAHTFETGATYVHETGDYRVLVAAHSREDRGVAREFTDESGVTGDVYDYMRGGNFSLGVHWRQHNVFLNGFSTDESYYGVTPKFASGAGEPHEVGGYLAGYSFRDQIADPLGLRFDMLYDYQWRDLSRSDTDDVRASVLGSRWLNRLVFDWTLSDMVSLELGGDTDLRSSYEYRNYNALTDSTLAANNLDDRSVTEYSAWGLLNAKISALTLRGGARYTNNELFGGNVSSTASAVYQLSERNSIKLMAGQSFRAPSLFELYFQTPSMTVLGNEDLDPERSTAYELAWLTSFHKVFLQVLGYHAVYENKIFRGKLPDGTSVYVNGDDFAANGMELELKYHDPSSVSGFLQFGYIDGGDGDKVSLGGAESWNFKYIPEWTAVAGLSVPIGKGGVSLVGHFEAEREGPFATIDAQQWLDASLFLRQTSGNWKLRHSIMVKNLTDEELVVPEYVRRGVINSVPLGLDRRVMYQLSLQI